MFDPWKYEADAFTPDDDYEDYIIMNERIRKYLDVTKREKDSDFFLIAPKGLGKTLLLRTKAHIYAKTFKGEIKLSKTDQLTENLLIRYRTFSKEDLIKFSELELWVDIWTFTLILVVLDTMDIKVHSKLSEQFENMSVSSIITELLNDRGKVSKYIHDYLGSLINQLKRDVKSGVALFIDNVDQQFLNILTDPKYEDIYENGSKISVDVWTNAQIGLIAAIHDINKANNHIRLFATIRSEAFQCIGQMKSQYMSQSCEIKYTKEETKRIFEKRIEYTKDKLINKKAPTPIEQFLGFTSMPHQFAKDESGQNRTEQAFDFLHRHSYGRPREIIRFGKSLVETLTYKENIDYISLPTEEKIEKVRELINDLSNELFKEYKNEIIPQFDNDKFELLAIDVHCNVITAKQLKRLDNKMTPWLYNLGLLGYAQRGQNNTFVQKFKPVSRYNYTMMEEVPNANYYFFHPSMDKTFDNFIDGNVYNDHNIIGDGYPFFEPTTNNHSTDIQYYFPMIIGDFRWRKESEYNKHRTPIKNYFNQYFTREDLKYRKEQIEKSLEVLTCLGKLKSYHLLSHKLKKDFTEKNRTELNYFKRCRPNREYQTMLDLSKENVFDVFSDRLFGRLITIGAFFFLNIKCQHIHDILTSGNFDLNPEYRFVTDSGNAVRYLNKAFFIRGLINDAEANDWNVKNAKKNVIQNVSEYEQKLLEGWFEDFIETLKDELGKENFEVVKYEYRH